ncbi:MAG: type IA DNA topoisomerase [Lachnospiraceae bacterium]|nr:type IA DNA topoisomerase [Lachnospiraceae bacterium]
MAKNLYIAEKPSVAQEFAKALKQNMARKDGYLESESAIVTWCVGHLVTMSYPEAYDEKYKRWSLSTLPFLPQEWKYEVIDGVKKQYTIVSGLLNRKDVECIYVCTDSGREGEYIYRLVEQMAGVQGKVRKRVWIDSQTEEEILRGIREAKDLSEYDNLSSSAYLRAKEDYLMGINFSRLLTLQYGRSVSSFQNTDRTVISVGRVMTCVLGMVVRREREIRSFVKTPFYRLLLVQELAGEQFEGEWKAVEGSAYYQSPLIYKENGFKKEEDARALIAKLKGMSPQEAEVVSVERKKETRYAPLLYNLAELQNDCSRRFKISPDETLKVTQELYEKKLVTYPRTDARVLSSGVAKEIHKNIGGLRSYSAVSAYAQEILAQGSYKGIGKSRYTNDKQITDHYAIIPTGQGLAALSGLSSTGQQVYELIVRRFLSIFYPPAIYQKTGVVTQMGKEKFFSNFKVLIQEGYLKVTPNTYDQKKKKGEEESEEASSCDAVLQEALQKLCKGAKLPVKDAKIKEGETSPPKRYNSGSMILAMENAGQLIEDEELRAQIKGSGIGTSATRAEILKKLVNIKYMALNKKTQIITPTLLGENIFDVVSVSIRSLLNPELTASWEKGLTYVANGEITPEEYMGKLEHFVRSRTEQVLGSRQHYAMTPYFQAAAAYYQNEKRKKSPTSGETKKKRSTSS